MLPSKLSVTQAIFLPRYKLQWVQTANCTTLRGREKKEVIMTNYTFSSYHHLALSLSNCSSNTAVCEATWFLCLPLFFLFSLYYLYFLDKTCAFAYLSHFKGWDDELHCLVLSITVSLVVMSLIISKDNAFNNRFNPNLSIIMIEDDILSYICEGMVHFSSPYVVFQILCSCNITLVWNFTKQWMWLFTKLISPLFKKKKPKK